MDIWTRLRTPHRAHERGVATWLFMPWRALCPPPRTLPDRLRVAPWNVQARTKVARAFVTALMGTEQVRLDPLHAPLHVRSFHPFAGDAASRTGT